MILNLIYQMEKGEERQTKWINVNYSRNYALFSRKGKHSSKEGGWERSGAKQSNTVAEPAEERGGEAAYYDAQRSGAGESVAE